MHIPVALSVQALTHDCARLAPPASAKIIVLKAESAASRVKDHAAVCLDIAATSGPILRSACHRS